MTSKELDAAMKAKIPVYYCRPNEKPVKATRILEIYYRYGERGNRIVSCVLQDDSCPNCVIKARGRYVKEKP